MRNQSIISTISIEAKKEISTAGTQKNYPSGYPIWSTPKNLRPEGVK
jgi:hypothetical protein